MLTRIVARTAGVVAILAVLAAPTPVGARAGDVDTSFGTGGVIREHFPGFSARIRSVLVASDGKIVVVGDATDEMNAGSLVLARYDQSGALDPSFGVGGRVITPLLAGPPSCTGAALQSNGLIVVADSLGRVLRFDSSGSLDGTFGSGGIAQVQPGCSAVPFFNPRTMTVDLDGRILIAGGGPQGFQSYRTFARILPDGDVDEAFGDCGVLVVGGGEAYALGVYPDGAIVAAGIGRGFNGSFFSINRLLPVGQMDSCFGEESCVGGGYVRTDFGGQYDSASAVVVLGNGQFVAGGTAQNLGAAALARYGLDGDLDATFGTSGQVLTTAIPSAHALARHAEGRLVAAGGNTLAAIRLDVNGDLDSSFGASGLASAPITGTGRAIAVQPDGAVLVGGATNDGAPGGPTDLVLVRYEGDLGLPGDSPDNPVLPPPVDGCDAACSGSVSRALCRICANLRTPCFQFCIAVNDPLWIDPPLASGFEYRMTSSDSLFAGIADFPPGFANGFSVMVGGQALPGTFGPGDSVSFGTGVDRFSVHGITPRVDGGHADAFPIKLAFTGSSASFNMRPLSCGRSRLEGCARVFEKGTLKLREDKPGKEQLSATFTAGPSTAQLEFGNPLVSGGTDYSLCIYGDEGNLAGSLSVVAAGEICSGKPCWRGLGGAPPSGRGYLFNDRQLSSSGVQSLKLQGGAGRPSSIRLTARSDARGEKLGMPLGIALALEGSTETTLQLVREDTGECFALTLARVTTPRPGVLLAR